MKFRATFYMAVGVTALLVAETGLGQTNASLRQLLERTATATGVDYIAARNQLIATERNAVAELTAISTNVLESWQIRLMAGIVAERITRGSEINEFAKYNWRRDPRYGSDWDMYHGGPVEKLMPLVTEKCKEKGLWWYYIELTWKKTGEHSSKPRIREDYWRGAYETACKGSPVYALMLEVAKHRIRLDIDFRNWETRDYLAYLEGSKTNTVLPFLLEILPHIPVADERNRPERAIRWIDTLAGSEDVPVVEEFYQKRGEQVPDALRPRLKALKERAGTSAK